MHNPIFDDWRFKEALSPLTTHLIAPASGVSCAMREQIKHFSLLKTKQPLDLFADEIVYHANTDEARLRQLQQTLYTTGTKDIIWCIRGGYGSARLIPGLIDHRPPLYMSPFIGCSDITALHLFLSQAWGWKTIHGSGFGQLFDEQQDPENFTRIAEIINQAVKHQIFDLRPLNLLAKQASDITGTLTGGNLTLVECSIGTVWQVQTAHKILFLEEVGEKGYRVDRSLYHLYQAGLFASTNAVVLGDFKMSEEDPSLEIALQRFAAEIPLPIYKTNQFGHGNVNYPWIYNAAASIYPREDKGNFGLAMQIDGYI